MVHHAALLTLIPERSYESPYSQGDESDAPSERNPGCNTAAHFRASRNALMTQLMIGMTKAKPRLRQLLMPKTDTLETPELTKRDTASMGPLNRSRVMPPLPAPPGHFTVCRIHATKPHPTDEYVAAAAGHPRASASRRRGLFSPVCRRLDYSAPLWMTSMGDAAAGLVQGSFSRTLERSSFGGALTLLSGRLLAFVLTPLSSARLGRLFPLSFEGHEVPLLSLVGG